MRRNGAALLHTLSFAIALFIQRMDDWPAMAYIFFFFAGCALLVFDGKQYDKMSLVRGTNLAWLVAVGAVVFLFHKAYGITPEVWCLASMPMLALFLKKENLWGYATGFGAVITLFAFSLDFQFLLGIFPESGAIRYTWFIPSQPAVAWPMIDPNNAALVLNCALLPFFHYALYPRPEIDNEDTRVSIRIFYSLLCIPLALALFFTGSKAGIICALAAIFYLSVRKDGWRPGHALVAGLGILGGIYFCAPLLASFGSRLPMWHGAAKLLELAPWDGTGVGTFANYYKVTRMETYSSGFFAHNDVLQIAIEMGIPVAFVFITQWLAVAVTTWKANDVSAAVLFVMMAQSMVEFQFYVPVVALLAGIAMAYHAYHRPASLF